MSYKKIVIFILLILQVAPVSASNDSSLITVVIMVKDEAPVICETLQPLIDGGIKNFLVYDTGSTDGTQDLARNLFKKHDVCHTQIVEEPFVDFATSRNKAIEHAERLFPETTFILMVDAEWYMSGVEELIIFCEQEKKSTTNSYLIDFYTFDTSSTQPNKITFTKTILFRPFQNIKYEGVVYENLTINGTENVPKNCFIKYLPSKYGYEKTAIRWEWDKEILLKSYAKNPFDWSTIRNLGVTYELLGDWENAYHFYKKSNDLLGTKDFIVELYLGNVAQYIPSQCAKESELRSPTVEHYLQAYALAPHRAEPLVKIAKYYLEKNTMPLAFLFSLQATRIPYPTNDTNMVEDLAYNLTRYDILGTSAWYLEEYEVGEWAARQAVAASPENMRLQNNLKFYTDRSINQKEKA